MQVSNFSDLFKSNSDLLSKDFPLTNKLEVNTNTENGIKLTSILNRDSKTSSAELKAKYSCKSFAVTETWNTANVLGLVAESTVNGVKLEANSTLNANNGKTASKFSAEFKQKNLFSRAFVDVFKGPTIGGDVVVGNDLLIVGGDVAYDVAEARVERFNAALAHVGNGYNLGLQASNFFGLFSFSYFHKVAPTLEVGAKASWNKATDSSVVVELASKYVIEKDYVKAKVNNNGLLSLGYICNVRPGFKASVGAAIDTSKFNEGQHKIGFAINFDA